MAKFYGAIGYMVEDKTSIVDVTVEKPVERMYKGDLVKNNRRLEESNELNDNVKIANQISILADPYALSHLHDMRYVRWMGVCWKVTLVDAQFPRLTLTLGGVYNGETAS